MHETRSCWGKVGNLLFHGEHLVWNCITLSQCWRATWKTFHCISSTFKKAPLLWCEGFWILGGLIFLIADHNFHEASCVRREIVTSRALMLVFLKASRCDTEARLAASKKNKSSWPSWGETFNLQINGSSFVLFLGGKIYPNNWPIIEHKHQTWIFSLEWFRPIRKVLVSKLQTRHWYNRGWFGWWSLRLHPLASGCRSIRDTVVQPSGYMCSAESIMLMSLSVSAGFCGSARGTMVVLLQNFAVSSRKQDFIKFHLLLLSRRARNKLIIKQ